MTCGEFNSEEEHNEIDLMKGNSLLVSVIWNSFLVFMSVIVLITDCVLTFAEKLKINFYVLAACMIDTFASLVIIYFEMERLTLLGTTRIDMKFN